MDPAALHEVRVIARALCDARPDTYSDFAQTVRYVKERISVALQSGNADLQRRYSSYSRQAIRYTSLAAATVVPEASPYALAGSDCREMAALRAKSYPRLANALRVANPDPALASSASPPQPPALPNTGSALNHSAERSAQASASEPASQASQLVNDGLEDESFELRLAIAESRESASLPPRSQAHWESWCKENGRFSHHRIDGDGNCLPNSLKIGAQLSGIELDIPFGVRAAVCSAASKMEDAHFSRLVEDAEGLEIRSKEQWIAEFAADGSFCDFSFVRVFCAAFKVRVHIVTSFGSDLFVSAEGEIKDGAGDADIHLAFFNSQGGSHYDLLVPVQSC